MFHRGGRPFRVVVGLSLLLYLLLAASASSPALHQAIHKDAKSHDHHCVITALTQGQIEGPVCNAFLSFTPAVFDYAPPYLLSVRVASLELLPPERGPPAFFLI